MTDPTPTTSLAPADFTVTQVSTQTHQQQHERMYFKLTSTPSRDALTRIEQFTNNFDPEFNISADFVQSLRTRLDSDDTIMEGFLYAPTDPDVCRQVIGTGGCYFHQTTTKQDIAMIWHDRTPHRPVFRFWGQKYNIIRAMNIIKHRIDMKS
tara:strand:- start:375 stop:830 length:456 start_codon:yes stop_codon:yes gene_type:complete